MTQVNLLSVTFPIEVSLQPNYQEDEDDEWNPRNQSESGTVARPPNQNHASSPYEFVFSGHHF